MTNNSCAKRNARMSLQDRARKIGYMQSAEYRKKLVAQRAANSYQSPGVYTHTITAHPSYAGSELDAFHRRMSRIYRDYTVINVTSSTLPTKSYLSFMSYSKTSCLAEQDQFAGRTYLYITYSIGQPW